MRTVKYRWQVISNAASRGHGSGTSDKRDVSVWVEDWY